MEVSDGEADQSDASDNQPDEFGASLGFELWTLSEFVRPTLLGSAEIVHHLDIVSWIPSW